VEPDSWPPHYDPQGAAAMRQALNEILNACLEFARGE